MLPAYDFAANIVRVIAMVYCENKVFGSLGNGNERFLARNTDWDSKGRERCCKFAKSS